MAKRGEKKRTSSAAQGRDVEPGAFDGGLRWITKRDGRRVAFDQGKIEQAIARAMEATGDRDESFAREVASVVELTLIERRRQSALNEGVRGSAFAAAGDPQIEEIQDLVERALMELGRPRVAKAYILYRDKRARARQAIRVHDGEQRASLRVRDQDGSHPWNKGRILAALVEEAELPESTAEEVANDVEKRVFASGLRRVSTGLIRELVAGELVQRGLTRAWKRQGAVGLPRQELRQVLRSRPNRPWRRSAAYDVSGWIGSEVLERFLTDDVLGEGSAELHRAGDLSVEGLGQLPRPLTLVVDVELLSGGGRRPTPTAVLQGAARLASQVSRTLVLESPVQALGGLVQGHGPFSEWCLALDAVAQAAETRIELASSGVEELPFTAGLVAALDGLGKGSKVGAYVTGFELEELLAGNDALQGAVERCLDQGKLSVVWGTDEESFAGPGCQRRLDEPGALACLGAVGLNLPRLARRAGPWNEEILFNGLAELVQAALEIAQDLTRFLGQETRLSPGGFQARPSFGLVPVGLREALLVLGEGEIDLEKGARLLGLLVDAAQRFAMGEAPRIVPTPFFGAEASRRFAWMDRHGAQSKENQGWLFAEASEESSVTPYTCGYAISPTPGWAAGRAEAQCLRTLPVGILNPVPRCEAGTEEAPPCIAGWRRFELFRRAHAGEVLLELFPTESAPGIVQPRRAPSARPRYPLRPLA